jgi:hypothetical protein
MLWGKTSINAFEGDTEQCSVGQSPSGTIAKRQKLVQVI